MEHNLDQLKLLTSHQYDEARSRALSRVTARIGVKPVRKQFVREYGAVMTLLDWLALAVFLPALLVSSIHIMNHMGGLAVAAPGAADARTAGTTFTLDFFTAVHQWAYVPLAEAAMLLFLVMFALSGRTWRKWVLLALALLASAFVVIANVQSGVGIIEALLPPAFTIGVGVHLEARIVKLLRRREDVQRRYTEALETWERASADPSLHPDFMPLLRAELWNAIIKKNAAAVDAPIAFRHAAVRREMERETWAFEMASAASYSSAAEAPAKSREKHGDDSGEIERGEPVESPLAMPVVYHNGNGRHAASDGD